MYLFISFPARSRAVARCVLHRRRILPGGQQSVRDLRQGECAALERSPSEASSQLHAPSGVAALDGRGLEFSETGSETASQLVPFSSKSKSKTIDPNCSQAQCILALTVYICKLYLLTVTTAYLHSPRLKF